MALTADAMLAALAKWGISPKFYRPDWRTHDRDAQQGFGPLYGFVVHNFGSDISDENSLAYLYRGDNARGMPGPLSQFSIDDDGTVWVIGWGATNHTGSISRKLHALVLKDAAPLDADFRPGVRSGDAGSMSGVNDNYLGVEMTYGKAPTAAQRASVVRLAAALMDALGPGYTGGSVIGHRECTVDRSDPVGFLMWQLRRDVNTLLKAGPAGSSVTPPAAPEKDDIMAMTPAERAQLVDEIATAAAAKVWAAPITRPGSKEAWAAKTALWSTNTYAMAAAAAKVDVDKLAATLAAKLPTDSVTKDEIKAALGEALAEGVQVTGSLEVNPKPTA